MNAELQIQPGLPPSIKRNPKVVVVGAGMSGMLAAIKMHEAGISDVTIYEKADKVGGTWPLGLLINSGSIVLWLAKAITVPPPIKYWSIAKRWFALSAPDFATNKRSISEGIMSSFSSSLFTSKSTFKSCSKER